MSNIVVVVNEKNVDVSVLKELHKILGGSLTKIRTEISKGLPIIEMEIFDSQYEEKASLLRRLIFLISCTGLKVRVYELPEGDSFETSSVRNESLISIETLENILGSSDDEMNRQLDM
ncbi:hypothetical protein [Marinobacter sp. ANT_B65]|uniref:hypothetical protein n=1 Tax=Marinobacter sp. ANT_B65 TaxID=2039467 RepID=UPI000BBE4649|nr:hypothetical protein [Marinobacter sp. ANT_B65]PCM44861.1 hypothetical protein CPA50_02170 [Marinobacter sp. ANT_B65]